MPSKPLLPSFQHVGANDFSDFYAIMARNVEDALITGGATPGKDYTILDLYKLAQPFVLHRWQNPGKQPLEYSLTWPDTSDKSA